MRLAADGSAHGTAPVPARASTHRNPHQPHPVRALSAAAAASAGGSGGALDWSSAPTPATATPVEPPRRQARAGAACRHASDAPPSISELFPSDLGLTTATTLRI